MQDCLSNTYGPILVLQVHVRVRGGGAGLGAGVIVNTTPAPSQVGHPMLIFHKAMTQFTYFQY